MAILKLKLDVTKLDKSAFFKGEKGTYCDLAVFINDEPDQYGNDASVKQDLGKDRRDEKLYVGNGKWVGDRPNMGGKQQAATARRQSTPGQKPADDFDDDDSSIPF
jgi:hypothetical protein